MPSPLSTAIGVPDDFASLLAALRPRLHRYCARMAGSALDGEDIVQDALARAALHYDATVVRQAEAWLFRIAHNAALDFLRHRALERSVFVDMELDDAGVPEEASDPQAAAEATAAALATFMHLPVAQRSAVILADVLGHALQEIAQLLGSTVPAVKAALHRGRTRLRELGPQLAHQPQPALPPVQQGLARLYAERFNARDFDGLRALLAEEVRLQLVGRAEVKGKAGVSNYFGNYARIEGWRAEPAVIEGQAGLWVYEPQRDQPAYGIVLAWSEDGALERIRDFRYARYVTQDLAGALTCAPSPAARTSANTGTPPRAPRGPVR
jgi:RNA polymerase sigma-70 factor (ECF subfamily)